MMYTIIIYLILVNLWQLRRSMRMQKAINKNSRKLNDNNIDFVLTPNEQKMFEEIQAKLKAERDERTGE